MDQARSSLPPKLNHHHDLTTVFHRSVRFCHRFPWICEILGTIFQDQASSSPWICEIRPTFSRFEFGSMRFGSLCPIFSYFRPIRRIRLRLTLIRLPTEDLSPLITHSLRLFHRRQQPQH
ncbi:hypothetical protein U1Q18_007171 [Sarracenia purpurea var. burkii]